MSRYDGELKASHDVDFDVRELLIALDGTGSPERTQAVARYLSGAEGWHEAMEQLDGAFAPGRRPSAGKAIPEDERVINQHASEYLKRLAVKRNGIDND